MYYNIVRADERSNNELTTQSFHLITFRIWQSLSELK